MAGQGGRVEEKGKGLQCLRVVIYMFPCWI